MYTDAAQRIVERFGKVFDLGIKRQIMGGGPLSGARFVVEHLGLPLSPEAYLAEREALLSEACKRARPMPGAVALVRRVRKNRVAVA